MCLYTCVYIVQLKAELERFRKVFKRNKIISSTFFWRRQRWVDGPSLGRRLGESKFITWYCGSEVVVWVAQDKGAVVNGAVGHTTEVRMMSTLFFRAWVALSLSFGMAPGRSLSVCPGPGVSFSVLSILVQPCHMSQLLGPPHHWG